MKNLRTIMERTNIPVFMFKSVADKPPVEPCIATTTDEAFHTYYTSPVRRDHEPEREAASIRWDEITFREAAAATTVEEIQDVYHRARHPDSDGERAALIRWNELSTKEVLAATTIDEILIAFGRAQKDSNARRLALHKIYELSPDEDKESAFHL